MKKLYNRNKDIELYHRQKLEKEQKMHSLTPKLKSKSDRSLTPNAKSNESDNMANNSPDITQGFRNS